MADKKRRQTSNAGNKRSSAGRGAAAKIAGGSRKRRRRSRGRLKGLIAAEIIVALVLVMIIGHNLGLGTGITNFINNIRKPSVKELDITGINSSYAILMNEKTGDVIGDINGESQMYPASMTKIMTTIVAIENLKDLNQEITITNDMVADLYAQDAMQAGFQPNETVKAIDLLYGVMLPSGAECCVALADTVPVRSVIL